MQHSPLCLMAAEILDQCLCCIDNHRDLMSFALTCRAKNASVIPRHYQYRLIRLRDQTPQVWAHLARRKDLSVDIRAVHLHDFATLSSPDISPSTLVNECLDGASKHGEEDQRVDNMSLALQNMDGMTEFAWSRHTYPYSRLSPSAVATSAHEDNVFLSLSHCPSLLHLTLLGDFGQDSTANTARDSDSVRSLSDHRACVHFMTHYFSFGIYATSSLCLLQDRPGSNL